MRRMFTLLAGVLFVGAGSAGAAVTISNTGTPAAGELLANTANQAITRIRLLADAGGGATITQVTLTKAGTAVNGVDWDQLDLYWDNGNGTFLQSEETQLGETAPPSGSTTTFIFSGFSQEVPTSGTRYLWAVVRTTATPVPGRTLRLSVATGGILVSSGSISGSATGNYKTVWGPIVSRGAFSAALGELPPSTARVPILQVKVLNPKPDVTITSVKLTKAGTAVNTTEWDLVDLWDDRDSSGTYSDGDVHLGSQPAGATATFTGLSLAVGPTATGVGGPEPWRRYLLATVRTTAYTVPGRTLRLSVAAVGDLITEESKPVGGTAVGNYQYVYGMTAALGAANPAAGTVEVNTATTAIAQFKVTSVPNTTNPAPEEVNITKVTLTASGTAFLGPDRDIDQFKLYVDAGTPGVLDGETAIATANPANDATTIVFGDGSSTLTTVPTGADGINLIVVPQVKSTAVSGRTISVRIAAMGDILGESNNPAAKDRISGGTATGNTFTIFGAGSPGTLTVSLEANPAAGGMEPNNRTGYAVFGFKLTASGAQVDVTSIKLTKGGTAVVPTEVDLVSLYRDDGATPGVWDESDPQLGSSLTAAATVTFTGSPLISVPVGDIKLFAVVKTTTAAVAGRTLTLRVAASGDVSGESGDGDLRTTVFSTGTPTSATHTFRGITVATGAATPATGQITAQSVETKAVFQIRVNAIQEAVTVTSVKLTQTGTAVFGTDIDKVSLYKDLGTAGVYDDGTDELLAEDASLSGTTETFPVTLAIASGGNANILVLVRTTVGSTPDRTVKLTVAANGDVSGTGTNDAARSGVGTATGNTFTLVGANSPGTVAVSLGANNPGAGELAAATPDIRVLDFKLTVTGNDFALSSVTLTKGGTATTPSEVDLISLYRDANANGQYDAGTDVLIGTQAAAASVTFGGISGVTVTSAAPLHLFALVRTTSAAVPGRTLTISVAAGAVQGTSGLGEMAGTTVISTGTAASGTRTFWGLTVAKGAASPAAGNIYLPDEVGTWRPVFQVKLSAFGAAVELTSVKLATGGTAQSTDIDQVRLYVDGNNDGAIDEGDTQIGDDAEFGAEVTFDGFSNVWVPTGTTGLNLLAAGHVYTDAAANRTITMSVAANGKIEGVVSSVTKYSVGTATSNTLTFFGSGSPGSLAVSLGPYNPAAGGLALSTDGQRVFQFKLTATGEKINITSVKLTKGGTTTVPAEINLYRLYVDADGNGVVSAGDTQIGSGLTAAASVTFTGITGVQVPDGTTGLHLLALVQTTANGVPGRTLRLRIAAAGDVTGTGQTSGSPITSTGTPTSATHTIWGFTVALGAATPPAGTISASDDAGDPIPIFQAKLTAYGEAINLTSMKITAGGDASLGTGADFVNFILYNDVNANAVVDEGDYVFETKTAAATVTFNLNGVALPTGTTGLSLLAVAEVGASPTAGRTLNLRVAAAGDVVGVGQTTQDAHNSYGTATSNTMTIVEGANPGQLAASLGANTPAAGQLLTNSDKVPVLQFKLTVTGSAVDVTSIKLTKGGTATVGTGNEVDLVYLYEDLGTLGQFDASDILVGEAQTAAGSVTFAPSSLTIEEGTPRNFLAAVRTTTTAVPGRTLTLRVAAAGDIVGTSESQTVNSVGTPTSNTLTFWGLTAALGTNNPPADTMRAGATNPYIKTVLQAKLTATGEAVTITQVTLTPGGTGTTSDDIDEIRLYADINNDGRWDSGDVQLGTEQTFVDLSTPLTFSGLNATVPTGATGLNLLGVALVKTTATAGRTLTLRINANGDVLGTGQTTSLSRNNVGTATSNTMTFADNNTPGTLTVSLGASSPAAGPIKAGADKIVVLQFKLVATGNAVTLNTVTLTKGGTVAVPGGVSLFYLYKDVNNNGQYDEGTDTAIGSSVTAGATAQFTELTEVIPEGATGINVLACVKTETAAAAASTLTLSIANAGDVTGESGSPASTVNSTGSAASTTRTFPRLRALLAAATPAAASLPDDTENRPVLLVNLNSTAEAITINSLTLTSTGTAALGTEITAIKLWNDSDADGTLDTGEPQIGSTWTTGDLVFNLSGVQVPSGGNYAVLVTVNTGTGVAGNTVRLAVGIGGAIGTGAVTASNLTNAAAATGNLMTFNGLLVSQGDAPVPANTSVGISSADVPIFQFKLSAIGEAVSVTQVVVSGSGTAELPTDFSAVKLYHDANGDGAVNGGDTQLSTDQVFSSGSVTFGSISGFNLSSGSSANMLVTVTTSATGVSGHTFSVNIAAKTAITHDGTRASLSTTPLASNTHSFAQGVVTVSGTDVTPMSINPGDEKVKMMRLTFATSGPAVQLSSIRVDNSYLGGSGNFSYLDIAKAYVYRDDGDGVYEPGTDDALMNAGGTEWTSSPSPGGSATVDFDTPETVFASAAKNYWVAYDIHPDANPLHTIGVRLADNTCVTTDGVGTVATTNFPIQLNTEHSLPVELTSFAAEAVGQVVKLAWATESETDNLYWIVERKEASAADATYVQVHRVDGMGSTPFRTDYEFVDRNVVPGVRYAYRLTDVSRYGVRKTHDPVEVTAGAALTLSLGTAFPNPANPTTTWAYSLPAEQYVRMALYNTLGQEVRVLVNGNVAAGVHQATWDTRDNMGRELASGVYICVLQTPTSRLLSRVTIVR